MVAKTKKEIGVERDNWEQIALLYKDRYERQKFLKEQAEKMLKEASYELFRTSFNFNEYREAVDNEDEQC